jgi:hypothetical protein
VQHGADERRGVRGWVAGICTGRVTVVSAVPTVAPAASVSTLCSVPVPTSLPLRTANLVGVKVPVTVPPLANVPFTADVMVPAVAAAVGAAAAGAATAGLPTVATVASARVPARASLAIIDVRIPNSLHRRTSLGRRCSRRRTGNRNGSELDSNSGKWTSRPDVSRHPMIFDVKQQSEDFLGARARRCFRRIWCRS